MSSEPEYQVPSTEYQVLSTAYAPTSAAPPSAARTSATPTSAALTSAALLCMLLGAAYGDERLEGIACRSVHLQYRGPVGTAFYNEVTVEKSAEGTYFCVCGFNHGYYGLQELRGGKKLLIFSVWDPGKQNDPSAIADEQRVKLLYRDDAVRTGRFGNEGTGGQSFFDYDWKIGQAYRFLVTGTVDEQRTIFTSWFFVPETKQWKKLVTFSTITGGKSLAGYYSFVEDFRRNKISTQHVREARFGNGWVRDEQNQWRPITEAKFTADRNPVLNINAGQRDAKFFLATGGDTKNESTPLNERIQLAPGANATPPANLPNLAANAANPVANRSQFVEQGGLPVRVHVYEDYESDIEKRWWLAGKLTLENVPESTSATVPNLRCFAAGESKNFDREMEDQAKSWKAVIFNPVPGPPMGPRTRLSFRYRLSGTDTLRVQLFSLSNGYHRFLNLTGLPQQTWQSATVDMTAARRPDGSGGALSENERIDDIQFYIPLEADLLIDDIVLYEAAAVEETRPFPRRIIFTGWFDTGKQGQEWPGTFEIVPHQKPLTWKAARSVPHETSGGAWIRVHLRGLRTLSKPNQVRFRYHLTGSDQLSVVLLNTSTGKRFSVSLDQVRQREWTDATIPVVVDEGQVFVDELHFLTGGGATLLVDDILLYE